MINIDVVIIFMSIIGFSIIIIIIIVVIVIIIIIIIIVINITLHCTISYHIISYCIVLCYVMLQEQVYAGASSCGQRLSLSVFQENPRYKCVGRE